MAQRIILHYLPGTSLLHRWDARCKFPGLLMLTLSALHGSFPHLLLDSALLWAFLSVSRLPLSRFFRDVKAWLLFLFVLFLFQVLFTPGSRFPSFPRIPATREGVSTGVLTFWRLTLVLGYAVLFTAVTRPRELQDAVIWYLRPFPFLPHRRIGLMVSLTFRFFSVILDEVEEVRLAHKSRQGDRIRNPLRRAKTLAFPVLRRSFSRAEDVTLALAARGYREDLPLQLSPFPISHLVPLLTLGILLVLAEILRLP